MEVTKEYIDEKFDELARMVAHGFEGVAMKSDLDGFATKEDIERLESRVEVRFQSIEIRLANLESSLRLLTEEVKKFVAHLRKLDGEHTELKVKYHELEQRVTRLESSGAHAV